MAHHLPSSSRNSTCWRSGTGASFTTSGRHYAVGSSDIDRPGSTRGGTRRPPSTSRHPRNTRTTDTTNTNTATTVITDAITAITITTTTITITTNAIGSHTTTERRGRNRAIRYGRNARYGSRGRGRRPGRRLLAHSPAAPSVLTRPVGNRSRGRTLEQVARKHGRQLNLHGLGRTGRRTPAGGRVGQLEGPHQTHRGAHPAGRRSSRRLRGALGAGSGAGAAFGRGRLRVRRRSHTGVTVRSVHAAGADWWPRSGALAVERDAGATHALKFHICRPAAGLRVDAWRRRPLVGRGLPG